MFPSPEQPLLVDVHQKAGVQGKRVFDKPVTCICA